MDIKEEIKLIAKRLNSGEKMSDEEIRDFINQSRDFLMLNSKIQTESLDESIYNFPKGFVAFTSCSCGAKENPSCGECYSFDESNKHTSMFAFSEFGDVLRLKLVKDSHKDE